MSLSLHKVSYYIFVHAFHYSLLYVKLFIYLLSPLSQLYRVYQNDWSCFEVDYIHKYG